MKFNVSNRMSKIKGSTFMTYLNKQCFAFGLNYSTVTDEKLEQGIKIFGEALPEIVDE